MSTTLKGETAAPAESEPVAEVAAGEVEEVDSDCELINEMENMRWEEIRQTQLSMMQQLTEIADQIRTLTAHLTRLQESTSTEPAAQQETRETEESHPMEPRPITQVLDNPITSITEAAGEVLEPRPSEENYRRIRWI